METFNLGIKAMLNDPNMVTLGIPDSFDGVRKLSEKKRQEILEHIINGNKRPNIVTPMERAWRYLLYTAPVTAIMIDENVLTYIFDSTSSHHKRIIDCFALSSRLIASQIEACMNSLPNEELSLKPAICTLYNYLRAPEQDAILLNKEETINDNLAQLIVNQLTRLSLHTAGEKALLAAFSSRRGRTSTTRSSTSTSNASSAVRPMPHSRAGTPTSRSQAESFTDSSGQTGDESRSESATIDSFRKAKKPRGNNSSRASRATQKKVPPSYSTRSRSDKGAPSNHKQVS